MSKVNFSVWDKDNVLGTALWEIKNEDGSLSSHAWATVLSDFLGEQGDFWYANGGKIELNNAKTKDDIIRQVELVLDVEKGSLKQAAIRARHSWEKFNRNNQIFTFLNEFFGEELNIPIINARIWPSSLCPYQKDGFCISSKSTPSRVLLTCVHEIMHLYWWQVWNKNFDKDDKSSWFLSEMAVETIKRNTSLNEIFSEYLPNAGNIAHNQFYSIEIRGKNVFDELDKIYAKSNYEIVPFMKSAYEFVNNNFFEINNQYYDVPKKEDKSKEKL